MAVEKLAISFDGKVHFCAISPSISVSNCILLTKYAQDYLQLERCAFEWGDSYDAKVYIFL